MINLIQEKKTLNNFFLFKLNRTKFPIKKTLLWMVQTRIYIYWLTNKSIKHTQTIVEWIFLFVLIIINPVASKSRYCLVCTQWMAMTFVCVCVGGGSSKIFLPDDDDDNNNNVDSQVRALIIFIVSQSCSFFCSVYFHRYLH